MILKLCKLKLRDDGADEGAEAGAGVLLLVVDLPVVGGEVVALHQNGTGGGDAHVPADAARSAC